MVPVSVNPSTTAASATVGGTGISTNNITDAVQAYLLTPPSAPQNDFNKYSTLALGGTQDGDFTRGDVILSAEPDAITGISGAVNPFTGISASTVAESVGSVPGVLETATSAWQISGTFQTTEQSIFISCTYSNDILAKVSGTSPISANARFGIIFSITDQHGHVIEYSPSELNTAVSAPINGTEIRPFGFVGNGLSLFGLTVGDTYTIAINGQSFSSTTLATPEPASLVLLTLASTLSLTRRRRGL